MEEFDITLSDDEEVVLDEESEKSDGIEKYEECDEEVEEEYEEYEYEDCQDDEIRNSGTDSDSVETDSNQTSMSNGEESDDLLNSPWEEEGEEEGCTFSSSTTTPSCSSSSTPSPSSSSSSSSLTLEDLRERFCLTFVRGKLKVVELAFQNVDTKLVTQRELEVSSFIRFYRRHFESIKEGNVWVDQSLHHYEAFAFRPRETLPDNIYNTWPGFACLFTSAAKEECEETLHFFLNHILHCWCNNSKELYDYVLKFLAHIIQKPNEPIGVALILRGAEGAGKGIIVNAIGKLLGRCYTHLSSQRELTAEFNAWVGECILVFADESTWGGDHQSEGRLKALITEPTVRMTKKFQDSEPRTNRVHLIAASNNDWVVPAGPTARRWVVLDVNPRFIGNGAHFDALVESMRAVDFYSCLLTYLDRYVNLHGFNPQKLPKECIKGLWDIKLRSLKPVQAWLYRALTTHSFGTGLIDLSEKSENYPKSHLFDAFTAWCDTLKINHHINESVFFKDLKNIMLDTFTENRQGSGERARVITFSSLYNCRKAFEVHVQTPPEILWGE